MANYEKFSKTIGDEQLDQVAGGTKAEMQKDIKFLNKVGEKKGIALEKYASIEEIRAAWKKLGVNSVFSYKDEENDYENRSGGKIQILSRQDAMIIAMRNAKQVVDLDDYD